MYETIDTYVASEDVLKKDWMNQEEEEAWKQPVNSFHVCIEEVDFSQGSLSQTSYVRYHHIFTVNDGIVLYKIAKLKPKKTQQILNELANLFGKKD